MSRRDSGVNDNSSLEINLRWFVQIMLVVGISVWGYFGLTERISFLEHNLALAREYVDMNSEFRVKWPRGELGALPDDAEQNMRLTQMEKQFDKRVNDLEDLEEIIQAMKYKNMGDPRESVQYNCPRYDRENI